MRLELIQILFISAIAFGQEIQFPNNETESITIEGILEHLKDLEKAMDEKERVMKQQIDNLQNEITEIVSNLQSEYAASLNDLEDRLLRKKNKINKRFDDLVNGLGIDCEALRDLTPDFKEGVKEINIDGKKVSTLCTQDGFTVIQSRGQFGNGQDYFFRNWTEYEAGFGVPGMEHWLGLSNIYYMTNQGNYQLRVQVEDQDGKKREYYYNTFQLTDKHYYTLKIGGYDGPSEEDSFTNHNGMKFSTKDRDNDTWKDHCAQTFLGAWWYAGCVYSNLNAWNYNSVSHPKWKGINMSWRGYHHSLKSTQMSIKRRKCT